MVVAIIFAVSGAGKTIIGKLLALDLGWKFYEADDYHPQSNVEKMKSGHPLNDRDRQPWLKSLREVIERCLDTGENAVLACSALKRKYRSQLRVNDQVTYVFLHGDKSQVAKQLEKRRGHFMNPKLLDSQFADLEEPEADEGVITVEIGRSPQDVVEEIISKLQ